MVQMQTLDELNKIESDIKLLEQHLINEELEQAELLLQTISEEIRLIFTSETVSKKIEVQQSAIKVYNTLTNLIDMAHAQKQGVAKSLSGHIRNKKKINAYKST